MARRILFYTNAFGGGGAELVFARLAHAFADAGDDVVFAADLPGPVPVRDRPNLRHVLVGGSHVGAMARLVRLLREHAPDASFSALGSHNLKHLAAAIIAGRRRRCVLGYHGFAEAEAKPFSLACYWGSALVTRLAARTVCVSDALLADMRERWRASRTRTLRIYNPIATAAPTRVASSSPALIVACGRLVRGKRFADLIAALPHVRPPDVRLAILGEGPERDALAAAAVRHQVADRVELPGHVDDPSPWYARAACVAVASESESFGLTVAEALAHGTPVVATRCGGPVELLEEGRLGRLVSIGDVPGLAAALTATIAAPGDDAPRRQRAEAFSPHTIHRSYRDLVDALTRGEA